MKKVIEKCQNPNMKRWKVGYPPIAPSRIASDCFATLSVSSGNGTPVSSNAAPPTGISRKSNLIPEIRKEKNNT